MPQKVTPPRWQAAASVLRRCVLLRLGLPLVLAGTLLAPTRARAADRADVAAADALFREARAAARAGDHATACPKFRESYRLDPAVGTLLNVADCEEREGHLVPAVRDFEAALGRLPSTDTRLPYVRSRIRALDARVPTIAAGPEGWSISVDNAEIDKYPYRVEVGKHEVGFRRGPRVERLQIALQEGESKTLEAPVAIAPEPIAEPHTSSSKRKVGLVLAGVGVAGLAFSGVATALMFDAKATADQHCHGAVCDPAGIDATTAGKRWGLIGGAAFGAGAVALGLGAFLFFTGRKESPITVGSYMAPGGGGLLVGGHL